MGEKKAIVMSNLYVERGFKDVWFIKWG